MTDLSFITELYFSDFDDPDVINTGWCFVWAWMAHQHTGAKLYTYELVMDLHALVEIDGRFYDSSAPRGVKPKRLSRLSIFRAFEEEAEHHRAVHMSPRKFRSYWIYNGRNGAWETQGLRPWTRKLKPWLPTPNK